MNYRALQAERLKRENKITADRDAGMTYESIGAKHGISTSRVGQILKRAQSRGNKPDILAERIARRGRMEAMGEAGASAEEIAVREDVPLSIAKIYAKRRAMVRVRQVRCPGCLEWTALKAMETRVVLVPKDDGKPK